MCSTDLLFAVTVLETPIGESAEHGDDSPIAQERAKIMARYYELRPGRGVSFTGASRQARAEWLAAFLASR